MEKLFYGYFWTVDNSIIRPRIRLTFRSVHAQSHPRRSSSPPPLTMSKRPPAPSTRAGVVILAAGYGTRLSRDIASTPAFIHLAGTPKPLLPVGGRAIVTHWVDAFSALAGLAEIVVVSNAVHFPLYAAWAEKFDSERIRVISDGSTNNASRLGAVAAMRIGVEAISNDVEVCFVVAGDTILPGVDVAEQLTRFNEANTLMGVFAYELKDPADCVRRGMLKTDSAGRATALVEKPSSVDASPSNLACAPVYVLRRPLFAAFASFMDEHSSAPLEKRDPPGFWVAWALTRTPCAVLRIPDRVDIGGLAHYVDALHRHGAEKTARSPEEPAVGRAYARAGLLGNPSDGYGGKTIAVALASEGFAEVVASPAERFSVVANGDHEMPADFASVQEMAGCVRKRGVHFGARALVVAAAAAFAEFVDELPPAAGATSNGVGQTTAPAGSRNCMLTYSTAIPTRLGLSGSSALILATFRALARFRATSLSSLDGDIASWPPRLRTVERELLGIECGLMDRVAQVYQGCVFMDFSEKDDGECHRIDERRLPELWIAYRDGGRVGEHSGKVHSNLGERFRAGDKEVIEGMKALGEIAERGRRALGKGGDISGLPGLMRENFRLRLQLVGKEAVGEGNLQLVKTANEAGFAAKMSGSGGAVICMADPVRELSAEEVKVARGKFGERGFVLRRVEVLGRCEWP